MKAINMIMIFLAFLGYYTIKAYTYQSNWVLYVKSEKYTDDIELRPGVLTRVVLSVRHQLNGALWDKDYMDKVNFTIAAKDNDNVQFYPNEEINIIPSESPDYIAYIGLKCNHNILGNEYNLDFELKEKKGLDGNNVDCVNLQINPVKVTINNSPTVIDIEPIVTNIPARGFSLFRLKNEIFNIEKVIIMPQGSYNKKKIKIEDIEIKPFLERKRFGKEESDEHGILFDHKFGTEYEYPGLDGQTNITFYLEIYNYHLFDQNTHYTSYQRCFDLSSKSGTVNFEINDKSPPYLNDSVKVAILNSIENVTPKKDKINNIQIKIDLPVAPVLIHCDLHGDGKGEEKHNLHFQDYILNPGQNIIKFNNLNSNNEYKGECTFSSVTLPKTEFKITMGNEKDKDFISPLFPSKSLLGLPQCIEFTLASTNLDTFEERMKKFDDLVYWFCNARMICEQNIISTVKRNFMCTKPEKPEIKNEDKRYRTTTICIGASPGYNPEEIEIENGIDEVNAYFEKQLDYFIQSLSSKEQLNYLFYWHTDMNELQFVSLKRYYDLDEPDLDKINLEVVTDDGLAKRDNLKFRIKSSNEQPIECFYNKEMKIDDQKRFMKLYHNKAGGKSIILNPNEEISFETHLKDCKDKNMFTLYMNCYNLPGAQIRYNQTGIFNAYTYLYTDVAEDQIITISTEEIIDNTTINCAETKNKVNPNCLKGTYNNLDEMLKTKMPDADEKEELEKFNRLSLDAKIDLLDEMFKNFDEEIANLTNTSQIIQNLINKEKFLTKRDCSIYANKSSNDSLNEINNNTEYKNCRENKKIKQKKIIEYLKDNLNCKYLSLLISQNGITNDVEQNIKYIILLIEEVTYNADSFSEGDSEVLLNLTTCLQENYEAYWNQVKEFLDEKGSLNITITAIKEDISNLLINTMANLVKVLHFDEIDNYISEDDKNITNYGLMSSKQGKQIHNSIKQFVKNFNEFGEGFYNLSDSLMINITINNDYKEKPLKEENELDEQAIKYENKGIILLLHPQSMMKEFNAYALQVISYESPLIPIKVEDDKDEIILNTFISITLYDEKGNEIKIDEIPEDIRPQILYDKEYHKYMNSCYFYNEELEDLSEKGVAIEDNYTYDGNEYLKCTTEHLTCFTAGNYYYKPPVKTTKNTETTTTTTTTATRNENKSKTGRTITESDIYALILLGSIFLVILLLVCIICIVKKKRNKKHEEKKKKRTRNIELETISTISSE